MRRSDGKSEVTIVFPFKIDGFVKSPKTIFGIHHDVVDHLISSIYCRIVFHFGLFTKPSKLKRGTSSCIQWGGLGEGKGVKIAAA